MPKFYGYDKHFKSIYEGCIIKFFDIERNIYRVGHLFFLKDYEYISGKGFVYYETGHWHVSFNHSYSESNEDLPRCRNITVIGHIDLDEEILQHYFDGYFDQMDSPRMKEIYKSYGKRQNNRR